MKHTFLLSFLLLSLYSFSQEVKPRADYERAVGFLSENIREKTYNLHININWFEDNSGGWFKEETQDGIVYRKVLVKNGVISDLFDHEKLAKLLSANTEKTISKDDLKLDDIKCLSAKEMVLTIGEERFNLDSKKMKLTEIADEEVETSEHLSPDGKWEAFTEDYNLFVKNLKTGEIKQLSKDGTKDYAYGSWYGWMDIMEGEGTDRPEHFGVSWSPDSKWVFASICDTRTAEKMYLLDWSVDSLYRPRLLSYFRGSPGDTTMVYQHSAFFNVNSGKRVEPRLPKLTHINSMDFEWSEKTEKVFMQYMSRGYQSVELLLLDLATGTQSSIYSDVSKTNIDNFDALMKEKLNRVFFLSERSGWRQLYSVNLDSKEVVRITKGEYVINDIKFFDDEEQVFYFTASGVDEGANPYHEKLYRIDTDGGNFKALTSEGLHHHVQISPDGKFFVDNMSTAQAPTKTLLRSTETGKNIAKLGEADVSQLVNYRAPQSFKVKARDGKTDIYGALWLPSNFDPSKKYPVVDHSYTGPHTHMFPVQFRYSLYDQALAELGFVVMRVDGLGSSGRSKAFHDHSYKNLGGNLEDHISALKQLSKKFNWIDIDRVGIYGHSAGGYDAGHAVLAYPDFYKVAVASSADHDHRMEKAWWPEMYMGWPVDSAYHLQSNITMAGNLKGKLLITHGGIDDNVNPSASFKLAEALIKADKPFDLLILPSQRHGYRGAYFKYFLKTRWNYFIEHLLDQEPVWDINWTVK